MVTKALLTDLQRLSKGKVKEFKKKTTPLQSEAPGSRQKCTKILLSTVSTGIPSILMVAISDSLKCIFRE